MLSVISTTPPALVVPSSAPAEPPRRAAEAGRGGASQLQITPASQHRMLPSHGGGQACSPGGTSSACPTPTVCVCAARRHAAAACPRHHTTPEARTAWSGRHARRARQPTRAHPTAAAPYVRACGRARGARPASRFTSHYALCTARQACVRRVPRAPHAAARHTTPGQCTDVMRPAKARGQVAHDVRAQQPLHARA
jgi:hypothetical protein